MSDPPTPLTLPPTLPYPITLTRLVARPGDKVKRGSRLFEYTFMSSDLKEKVARRRSQEGGTGEIEDEKEKDDLSGTWESLVDGDVVEWKGAKQGMVIERNQASQVIVTVQQACSHPVQLHGMCGVCGADLTEDDYLSRPASNQTQAGPSRYPGGFEIAHDAMGVTVSKNEAQRLENLTRDALLSTRRLSLIVDLDQTIIHTTVDPTVAEWMDEIHREESEDDQEKAKVPMEGAKGKGEETTTPPGSPGPSALSVTVEQPKEKNPNAEALRDVAKFQIADDLPPGYVKLKTKTTKGQNPPESEGRWYFTKPRPGLQKFLDEMSQLYEMHVYTMGTRTYADAIVKVIDPDGKIFGGRILSRDESGSFSSKNLKRLFPTDTSMVVVIDDRSDVWGDCPNLVKVVPYDFFLGIGDINSSFLPTNKSTPPPSSAATTAAAASSSSAHSSPSLSTSSSPPPTLPPSPPSASSIASTPPPVTPSEVSADLEPIERVEPVEPTREEELMMKAKLLDQLSTSRPLARLQEELEKEDSEDDESGEGQDDVAKAEMKKTAGKEEEKEKGYEEKAVTRVGDDSRKERSKSPNKHRKPLLNPNDYELVRVANILQEIHSRFYKAFDALDGWNPKKALPMSCDVEFIIPEMKAEVLDGCSLVFSGMIPRESNPSTTTIWQTAESFGALITPSLTPRTTHLVTALLNTEKTWRAGKMEGVKVVWAEWFWDSVALWERQNEEKYIAGKKEGADDTGKGAGAEGEARNNDNHKDLKEEDEDGEEHEDMNDDTQVGQGWDEEAEREWEEFMAGEDDWSDEEGSVGSKKSVGSVKNESAPPTPSKKRVRYADEELLPLEEFKDPSPTASSDAPPSKRHKTYLVEDTKPGQEGSGESQSRHKDYGMYEADVEKDTEKAGDENGGRSAERMDGTEGDDEFALLLMNSLANDDADGDENNDGDSVVVGEK
ncbi:RNA polymerase II subunit A domain phosphatase [Cryptococcus neoformans C23]|uniref:RNA polymerase II subunit A C-terminal domain phosphatase n=1 Tax=Cryptococcus neoformans (strain H99 / ATCC 208821 / CBS 10515 / FGSC 9487) TaxID=235443 RepID=J9VQV9_CRYN9|nr:RNA polymerase II subunit A domain phosphatase [Cryptococcus neoformans var. grubii H99]AUB26814.1 RNA polymerase II subunit A domain phosphatase [Cryptococcus neoformans var. grubii]OWZ41025.1 RNA polymerase II subunit A domain phosphatase [Cryptococcus neoformans var. grubii C23]OXC83007.1 RNA polymerase II subunit A domain phosphatase [Cryptococcus neoformans var. grubii AD1-7a]AFR96852.2 RNA polymerase II subunit A domain phosphatase [Cryptococcus neoformans var. grubii H99]OXH28295.1 R|eukprot:XP_012051416.1 RNA polymerase II subunit A domain phosphatase [Cryptococcus neoformans var. grubii H99]